MKGETAVSIVVPVYNKGLYLRACMESLIQQTLENIEIICVDDCSDDDSVAILNEYAEKDRRIVIICHDTNRSTSQCRKDGVAVSTGRYVMFLDADDYLSTDACETAYNAIEKYQTDMVQFDTWVENAAGVSEGRIKSNQRMLYPHMGEIKGDLIRSCWIDKEFGFNLWNKIYKGSICRKAFSQIEDGSFPKAQDLYAFFLIAYYSESYYGIEDKLYHYNFGIGTAGNDYLDLERFNTMLTEIRVSAAIKRFITDNGSDENLIEISDLIYDNFLNECVSKWVRIIHPKYRSQAFENLVACWGIDNVICKLAEKEWYSSAKIAGLINETGFFKYRKRSPRKKKTIAAYYRSISNGGAQRVVAMLCNKWANISHVGGGTAYNVILITDQPEDDSAIESHYEEYELSPKVRRAYLPSHLHSIGKEYRKRYLSWAKIIDEYDIDIVVSSMWVASCTFWDMLAVKGRNSKPAFMIHSHNFAAVPFKWSNNKAAELMEDYRICDGVVTLSATDKRYVSAFNNNTKCITNPITFDPRQTSLSRHERNTIIWVGRLSHEKRPLDAIRMMGELVKTVPDSQLYIVGDGDEKIKENMNVLIDQSGLQDNVTLCGFTLDVDYYYDKAAVFVCTSEYEGFSLVICEALSHGVPVVTYDMPWLPFIEDGRGIKTVGQERFDLLADEVAKLLINSDYAVTLGKEGKHQVEELSEIDIAKEWQQLFDSVDEDKVLSVENEAGVNREDVLMEYITLYTMKAKASLINQRNRLNSQLNKVNGECNQYRKYFSSRIDIKAEGGEEGAFSIESRPGVNIKLSQPEWLQAGGYGCVLTTTERSLDFTITANEDISLKIWLRGEDVRSKDNIRIPVWINIEYFDIGGSVFISKRHPVCHDKPYVQTTMVPKGRSIKVRLVWSKPLYKPVDSSIEKRYRELRSSLSCRVGFALTYIPRKLADHVLKFRR